MNRLSQLNHIVFITRMGFLYARSLDLISIFFPFICPSVPPALPPSLLPTSLSLYLSSFYLFPSPLPPSFPSWLRKMLFLLCFSFLLGALTSCDELIH